MKKERHQCFALEDEYATFVNLLSTCADITRVLGGKKVRFHLNENQMLEFTMAVAIPIEKEPKSPLEWAVQAPREVQPSLIYLVSEMSLRDCAIVRSLIDGKGYEAYWEKGHLENFKRFVTIEEHRNLTIFLGSLCPLKDNFMLEPGDVKGVIEGASEHISKNIEFEASIGETGVCFHSKKTQG